MRGRGRRNNSLPGGTAAPGSSVDEEQHRSGTEAGRGARGGSSRASSSSTASEGLPAASVRPARFLKLALEVKRDDGRPRFTARTLNKLAMCEIYEILDREDRLPIGFRVPIPDACREVYERHGRTTKEVHERSPDDDDTYVDDERRGGGDRREGKEEKHRFTRRTRSPDHTERSRSTSDRREGTGSGFKEKKYDISSGKRGERRHDGRFPSSPALRPKRHVPPRYPSPRHHHHHGPQYDGDADVLVVDIEKAFERIRKEEKELRTPEAARDTLQKHRSFGERTRYSLDVEVEDARDRLQERIDEFNDMVHDYDDSLTKRLKIQKQFKDRVGEQTRLAWREMDEVRERNSRHFHTLQRQCQQMLIPLRDRVGV